MTAAAVQPGPWRRRLRRTAAALGLIVALGLGFMIVDGWRAFGHRATGARRARMERSPQWRGRPLREPAAAVERRLGRDDGDVPRQPVRQPDGSRPDGDRSIRRASRRRPPTGLRVTWLGHATMLIEIDGHRVLTDPVWSERASPYDWIGPRRWYTPRIALADAAADRRGRHLARSLRSPGPPDDRRHRRRCRTGRRRLRRAAGDRRAPRLLGRARIAHRRARLVGPDARRRPGDRLRRPRATPRGARAVRSRRHAVGGLRARRHAPPRVLLGRHRPVPRHARHRRAPGPVRRHDDRGRAVPPGVARLAHRARAGGARPRHGARAR